MMRGMKPTLDEIQAAALELPEESRAELMEVLLLSFEDAEDRGIINAWAEEAERRDEEMTRTGDPGIPADEVFERLRSSLRRPSAR
jgi:hypothetical protein